MQILRLNRPALAAHIIAVVLLANPSVVSGQVPRSASELLRIADQRFFNISDGELTEAGEIWIANSGSHEVLQFSTAGDPVRAFGREGQGPGEFRSVSSVSVAGDSVFVGDLRLGHLTAFDSDGTVLWVRGLGGGWWLGAEFMDRLADGSVVLLKHEAPPGGMIGHVEFEAVLYRAANVGGAPEVIASFAGLEQFYRRDGDIVRSQSIPFAPRGIAASSGSVVAYGATDEPVINRYAPDRQFDSVILTAEPVAATGELIRREQRRLLGLAPGENVPQAVRARMAGLPKPEVLPLYQSLAVDDDGAVWVVAPANGSAGGVLVTILRPDGNTTEVAFPNDLEILDITSDSVLVVEHDALDVESVVLYRLVD